MSKNVIQINGVISKVDNSEINEEMLQFIQDKILMMLDEQGFMFGGSWKHQSEEDYMKDLETQIL